MALPLTTQMLKENYFTSWKPKLLKGHHAEASLHHQLFQPMPSRSLAAVSHPKKYFGLKRSRRKNLFCVARNNSIHHYLCFISNKSIIHSKNFSSLMIKSAGLSKKHWLTLIFAHPKLGWFHTYHKKE